MKNLGKKFEGIWILNRHATYQQIVVKIKREPQIANRKPQDNTGLSHYVISVRKTSVVGSNKRELEVVKSFKNQFSTVADSVARQ